MPSRSDERVDLGQKLKEALDSGAMDPAALAKECGVSRQAVYGWLKTGRVAKEHLPVFAKLSGKPLEWWLGSDVSKTKDEFTQSSTTAAYNPKALSVSTLAGVSVRPIVTYESLEELPKESTVLVTRIDVELSAGNGRGESWHIEEKEPLPFQADYIRRLDAKPKNLVAVKVDGDSMEPRLFDDDTVIVDRADTRIPANGGVFALVYAGELLVKRLFRLPDGGMKVVSDNHERYEPIAVNADQVEHITVIGRVKYRSGMGDF
ncbi:LexA family transcriptional regulator [Cupriavidus taiwanensis]|uniref:LexA family transcriptional regulator n=1 Tax=Cupriavidus taiwanensis TaxID=164546 RepID=UPI000E150A4E|nr:S24 family peptidase [Cupriavidus taiwanensis]SPA44635.1 putative phage repressor [Cupriavidus taiwanensis]